MSEQKHKPDHEADHVALLRAAGLRKTRARLATLDVLCHASEALTAQDVAELVEQTVEKPHAGGREDGGGVDRVTVYRTLGSFVDAGIAHKVDPGDRVFRYAMSGHDAHASVCAPSCTHDHVHKGIEDVQGGGVHPHLVCDQCGKVECMEDLEVVIQPAHGHQTQGGALRRVRAMEVMLHGVCKECSVAERTGSGAGTGGGTQRPAD